MSPQPPPRRYPPWRAALLSAPASVGLLAGLSALIAAHRLDTLAGVAVLASLGALIAAHQRIHRLQDQLSRAQHEAHHDPLTGLPNRRATLRHLAASPVELVGLLDLDGFKTVNDRHGHHVGDHLLIAVAERLRVAIGDEGIVTRLSGDEFVVLWTSPSAHPDRAGAAVLEHVTAPLTLDGHQLIPAASLGLARPGPNLSGATLLRAADHAMYKAKKSRPQPGEHTTISYQIHLYDSQDPPEAEDRSVTGHRSPRDQPATDLTAQDQEPRKT